MAILIFVIGLLMTVFAGRAFFRELQNPWLSWRTPARLTVFLLLTGCGLMTALFAASWMIGDIRPA